MIAKSPVSRVQCLSSGSHRSSPSFSSRSSCVGTLRSQGTQVRRLSKSSQDTVSCQLSRPQVAPPAEATASEKRLPTIEEQRAVAKQLVSYFNDRKYYEDYKASRTFGWTSNAELANSRWVMFGLMVGLMTEYATGIDFVDQIRLTISNMGIADIYE